MIMLLLFFCYSWFILVLGNLTLRLVLMILFFVFPFLLVYNLRGIGRRMPGCEWVRERWILLGVGFRNSNLEWKLDLHNWMEGKMWRMCISLWLMRRLRMQRNRRLRQRSSISRTTTKPKWSVCKIGRRGKVTNTYTSWYCEHAVFLWTRRSDSLYQSQFNPFSYWNIVGMWCFLWCGGIELEFWPILACICFLIHDMKCFLSAP